MIHLPTFPTIRIRDDPKWTFFFIAFFWQDLPWERLMPNFSVYTGNGPAGRSWGENDGARGRFWDARRQTWKGKTAIHIEMTKTLVTREGGKERARGPRSGVQLLSCTVKSCRSFLHSFHLFERMYACILVREWSFRFEFLPALYSRRRTIFFFVFTSIHGIEITEIACLLDKRSIITTRKLIIFFRLNRMQFIPFCRLNCPIAKF